MHPHLLAKSAFTIIEVLVVILLIGLLAAFVVPRFIERTGQAKYDITRPKIAIVESSLMMFYQDCGRFPAQNEGLEALLKAPQSLTAKWRGPYCKESDLLDPWGKPFLYLRPGLKNTTRFDLVSYGADGLQGGEGENADIYNN